MAFDMFVLKKKFCPTPPGQEDGRSSLQSSKKDKKKSSRNL
jgi:hypothetical protein